MDENGVLTGYKIYYQKVTGTSLGPLQERKKLIDPKFDRAKLAGLEPNTKYRIEIRAKTKAGEGDKYYVEQTTKSVINAQPDTPAFEASMLTAKEGTAHILVRWLPALDGHPGTHFKAWYKLKGHPKWTQTNEVTEDDYVILTGLEPGKVYEVKITAHDGEYFSSSDIKEVDTTNDGPLIMPDDKMATAGWFIGVMLALAFLLLVLVLVASRGATAGGNTTCTTESWRTAGETTPTPASTSTRTPGMNEDGSFIGQYGRKRRPPAASHQDSASGAFATLV
ncbi:hypothetical protein MSG28_008940 [Choristoneura fumiferana]|uniref:Uncharacterized protein n=1 Tax=Choristoneura fumiferana TaxID=7141 RepID=A0ACC0J8K4_CHOFU|nr:hypothetical protein MSG28_008940 [Choristoneura fumiferana]